MANNIDNLQQEFNWFLRVAETSILLWGSRPSSFSNVLDVPSPTLVKNKSSFGKFVRNNGLNKAQRVVLTLALVPHLEPEALEVLRTSDNDAQLYTLPNSRILMPTGETALFLLGGKDLEKRLGYHDVLRSTDQLFTDNVLQLIPLDVHAPKTAGMLAIQDPYLESFLYNSTLPA